MFPMIDFCFSNYVSVYNVHESLLRRFEIKYVSYIFVRVSRSELIQSRVVFLKVSYDFSKPISHLFANRYGVTE